MSTNNARKSNARYVQHALEEDTTLAKPSYQWCLNMVVAHYEEARNRASSGDISVKDALVAIIKPKARKAG